MGWFKSLTKAVARVDRATNPIHKAFQDKLTKKYFDGNNEKALAVVHGVGVTVLDIVGGVFGYPGAGSFLNGTDQAQDGNTKGAIMSFASAAVQVGGSTNTSGWSNLTSSSTASTATSTTASVAGDSSVLVAYDAPTDYSAAFGAGKTVVGSGIYGYTGAVDSTVTGIPGGTYTIGTGGGIGIDYATAVQNGIPNLTLKDIKAGAGFIKSAAGLYDLMTRDGTVTATYGKAPVQINNFTTQFSAPTDLGNIPSNRAADLRGAAQAEAMAAARQKKQMIALAAVCGLGLYFAGAFR